MIAKCYIDIKALGVNEDMPFYVVIGRAVRILHGAFSVTPDKYALCFPASKQGADRSVGHVVRIFAESSHDLYALIEMLKGHYFMRDYVLLSMPKDVPEDFDGTWSTWQRIRVQKKEGVNRKKTIKRARQHLFFEMLSSNGRQFPFRVSREISVKQASHYVPSSYGFSKPAEPFSLPDLPV